MIVQFLETIGLRRAVSRIHILALATLLLVGVMALEWVQNLDYSLGVFYVIPVVVAATVLNGWQTLLAAFLTACARSLFVGQLSQTEFTLRFLMALLAYGGIGCLVSEMNRNRRTILAALARVRLEEDLRRHAEDQLRILVESSPAGIMTLNHRAEVLAANRAAHEMLGFPEAKSLVGLNISHHVPVFAGALRFVPGGGPMRVSSASWAKRANGTQFPVAVWFSTYEEASEPRLAAILVDISEDVRERKRESFRHLTESSRLLAGAVAHEIRNLCSAVRVVTSNLRRHPAISGDADFGALNTLVESLMRIAAFELSNKGKEHIAVRVDLAAVLEEVRLVIEPDWNDIDGEIIWDTAGVLPYVHADEHSLLQVFLNLFHNSLRAVQQSGEARLEIRAAVQEDQVVLTFQDAGPGIADTAKLFQPFRENSDGTGLGLYVSRALLRAFGGELIHVPTAVGCRFDIVLPSYKSLA